METPDTLSLFASEGSTIDSNPLMGRKIAIEGTFLNYTREVIKTIIKRLGGEVVTGDVTKNVHFFLVGKNASQEKMDKYGHNGPFDGKCTPRRAQR